LNSNDFIWRSSRVTVRIRNGSPAWWTLPELVDVLSSEAPSDEKEQRLDALLRDQPGIEGTYPAMIKTLSSECVPGPDLIERASRIRRDRESRGIPQPTQLKPVVEAPVTPQARGDEPVAADDPQRQLDTAIPEMIAVLRSQDYESFVTRFVQPERQFRYRHSPSQPMTADVYYDFTTGPQQAALMLKTLETVKGLTPVHEGAQAYYTWWYAKLPSEKALTNREGLWYYD
jgi:hypothetical protein